MRAVAVHTTMVSTNTPRDCTRPCWTGWATVAVAAALGTEPSPASLENRPRLMPLSAAAVNPPARPAKAWLSPKAPSTMLASAAGMACALSRSTVTARRA